MMKMMALCLATTGVVQAVPNTSHRQLQSGCEADLTTDGDVNVQDLLALLAAYGSGPAGDINGDGAMSATCYSCWLLTALVGALQDRPQRCLRVRSASCGLLRPTIPATPLTTSRSTMGGQRAPWPA